VFLLICRLNTVCPELNNPSVNFSDPKICSIVKVCDVMEHQAFDWARNFAEYEASMARATANLQDCKARNKDLQLALRDFRWTENGTSTTTSSCAVATMGMNLFPHPPRRSLPLQLALPAPPVAQVPAEAHSPRKSIGGRTTKSSEENFRIESFGGVVRNGIPISPIPKQDGKVRNGGSIMSRVTNSDFKEIQPVTSTPLVSSGKQHRKRFFRELDGIVKVEEPEVKKAKLKCTVEHKPLSLNQASILPLNGVQVGIVKSDPGSESGYRQVQTSKMRPVKHEFSELVVQLEDTAFEKMEQIDTTSVTSRVSIESSAEALARSQWQDLGIIIFLCIQ
jgi:hypothetical protein